MKVAGSGQQAWKYLCEGEENRQRLMVVVLVEAAMNMYRSGQICNARLVENEMVRFVNSEQR